MLDDGCDTVEIAQTQTGDKALNASDHRLVVVSGCSGGGKSTLLEEMARRGHAVMPEPGREIVREQTASGGNGLPWTDMARFAELCIGRSIRFHREAAARGGTVLFDRSLLDAVNALEQRGLPVGEAHRAALEEYRYARIVFMAPPWEELFASDAERQHGFRDAVAEYEALMRFYPVHGYSVTEIPRGPVKERADFLEREVTRIG